MLLVRICRGGGVGGRLRGGGKAELHKQGIRVCQGLGMASGDSARLGADVGEATTRLKAGSLKGNVKNDSKGASKWGGGGVGERVEKRP